MATTRSHDSILKTNEIVFISSITETIERSTNQLEEVQDKHVNTAKRPATRAFTEIEPRFRWRLGATPVSTLAAEVHLLGLVRAVGYRVEDDAALVAPPGQEVPEALLRAPSCLDGFRENLI